MSKELLDNVHTIENAIEYLKGNSYIKEDSYSMEALHLIEKALNELEELKKNLHEYFELEVKSVTQAIYDRERHKELKYMLIKEGKKCLI